MKRGRNKPIHPVFLYLRDNEAQNEIYRDRNGDSPANTDSNFGWRISWPRCLSVQFDKPRALY